MRKRIVLNGTAVVIAFLTGALAWAAPGAGAGPAAGGSATARQAVSVQRLLADRLDWAVKLARLLQASDVAPAEPTVYSTHTIIDEPDPTSARRDGERPDHWPVPLPPRSTDKPGPTQPAQPLH